MSEKVRAFVAVLLSEEVRTALAGEVERLRRMAPGAGWVRPENVHLTLKFLGHVSEETLARAAEGLAQVVTEHARLVLGFQGLGAFPGPERPRVIWIGVVEGSGALVKIQSGVEQALAEREIPREDRPFHPHLTLGRVKEPRQARPVAGALRAAAATPLIRQEVSAIHLVRSDLHPQGVRYTVLRSFPLGTA